MKIFHFIVSKLSVHKSHCCGGCEKLFPELASTTLNSKHNNYKLFSSRVSFNISYFELDFSSLILCLPKYYGITIKKINNPIHFSRKLLICCQTFLRNHWLQEDYFFVNIFTFILVNCVSRMLCAPKNIHTLGGLFEHPFHTVWIIVCTFFPEDQSNL